MRIREAVAADAWVLARVHVASWQTTYRGLLPDEFLDGLSAERRAGFWQAELSNPRREDRVYVAEDGQGRICGFASGGPERTGNPDYRGELYAIYLLKSHQRMGIGRRLVTAVARYLLQAGLSSMLVWVLAGNPARRFYEALGGEPLPSKTIRIGETDLLEVSYGWKDVRRLVEPESTNGGGSKPAAAPSNNV